VRLTMLDKIIGLSVAAAGLAVGVTGFLILSHRPNIDAIHPATAAPVVTVPPVAARPEIPTRTEPPKSGDNRCSADGPLKRCEQLIRGKTLTSWANTRGDVLRAEVSIPFPISDATDAVAMLGIPFMGLVPEKTPDQRGAFATKLLTDALNKHTVTRRLGAYEWTCTINGASLMLRGNRVR
jgi:hypothetical protein